jgi:hypothetical protein
VEEPIGPSKPFREVSLIENDDQLRDAVADVNAHIQAIQDYLGQGSHVDGKMRFPRGFLRQVSHFRSRLGFINDGNLKKNLSYALILSDVFRWIINRTDLAGIAKEMVIKNVIILMGSICESMAIDGTKGVIGKKHSFCERASRMVAEGVIDPDLRDKLHWLWDKRTSIHIYELNHQEYDTYEMADYNKAVTATKELRDSLERFHGN